MSEHNNFKKPDYMLYEKNRGFNKIRECLESQSEVEIIGCAKRVSKSLRNEAIAEKEVLMTQLREMLEQTSRRALLEADKDEEDLRHEGVPKDLRLVEVKDVLRLFGTGADEARKDLEAGEAK